MSNRIPRKLKKQTKPRKVKLCDMLKILNWLKSEIDKGKYNEIP